MHFCALNQMGNRQIPHAGFPICNLGEMMNRLVRVHGMSVVRDWIQDGSDRKVLRIGSDVTGDASGGPQLTPT